MDDIFQGFGAEITFAEKEDFLKIKETLTRIGITAKKEIDGVMQNVLYQTCHILHKKGRYAIFHFKELYLFDGRPAELLTMDIGRRNRIVTLLNEWKLLNVVDPEKIKDPIEPLTTLKVLRHEDKKNWILIPNYQIGIPKRKG